MKKILYITAFIMLYTNAFAQIDRTKAPKPAPAPEIQIGESKSFVLKNGLKVFVVENQKLPRITFSLVLDNGPLKEGDKAGYASIAGQLLRNGTTNRTKAQLDEEVDFIGASLSTSSSGIFASSLSKHKVKVLELMTDVIYNPAFAQEEFDKIKKQTVSSLAQQKESPDAIISNVKNVLNFGAGHPYGEIITEATVENITLQDTKDYYNKYFMPNNAYLAIVGDISFSEAKKLVKKYFSSWERAQITKAEFTKPTAPQKTEVAIVTRENSVQSTINVTYPIDLKPTTKESAQMRVLNQILGAGGSARLFLNLREDKGYTYGAYSGFNSDDEIGSFTASASVRNEVTDSAVFEFLSELNKIRTEDVTDKELKGAKAAIIGSFARSLERPSTVASFAINKAKYNLNDDYYKNYLKTIEAVTKEDIKSLAAKYIRPDNAYILIVGKSSEIAEKLKRFGEVKYYDISGNQYDPSKEQLPAGLNAQAVIERYLKVIGGVEKLRTLKTLQMQMSANAMGNNIDIVQVKKSPGLLYVEGSMAGNVIMKQVVNSDEVKVTSMGNAIPLDDKAKFGIRVEASMIPELMYANMNIKLKLVSIEQVEGKSAYAIELTYPGGNKVTSYYDKESGLKIRDSSTQKTPQGEVVMSKDYLDYQEVEGIMFPFSIKTPLQPGFTITNKVKSIKINEEVSDDKFK